MSDNEHKEKTLPLGQIKQVKVLQILKESEVKRDSPVQG